MRKKMGVMFFMLIFLISTGCKKDITELPFEKINLPVTTTIRDVEIIDSTTMIICGGENQSGVVLYSFNAGVSWTVSNTLFDNSVNALYFLSKDTGFVADADILIYRTTNGGVSWTPFYATSWPLSVNRNLRDIYFSNDSTGFVCGGKNFGNGVVFSSTNKGESWSFAEYNHELRGVCFNDDLHGVICGYGALMHTQDGGRTFTMDNAAKEFYTGICKDALSNFWMCDFDGGVYYSSDSGISWIKTRQNNESDFQQLNYNCIDVSASGRIVVAGTNGVISWSNDMGGSWYTKKSFDKNEIFKVKWINGNQVMACGKNGGLFLITL